MSETVIESRADGPPRRLRRRFGQLLLLAAVSGFSIFVGVSNISIFDLPRLTADQAQVLLISRLPRLVSVIITGASLSIAGLIMQSLTQNRFVSPTTAGTMEWCRFGVMFAILAVPDAPLFLRFLAAFLVSLAGTLIFIRLISGIRFKNIIMVPLAGMMLGSVVNSVTTFFAYQHDIIQNMSSWLQGNFSLVIKGNYELLYFSPPLLLLAYFFANHFTIAGLGRDIAAGLGLNHDRIMKIGLVIVALISSITIVGVGNIPFLGLVVPNLVSIYRGDSIKDTLFDTAWLGAMFVLVCDLGGRLLIYPYEIPIGIIISVAGSLVFLALIFRRARRA